MIRYGAEAQKMKSMAVQEFFMLHVALLIIMTKAYIKGNPLGEFRKKAIIQSARYVFSEARTQSKQLLKANQTPSSSTEPPTKSVLADHIFLQRVQMLAVSANAYANSKALGQQRNKAIAANIEGIRSHMSKQHPPADALILKVA